jgi:hypothetical protein
MVKRITLFGIVSFFAASLCTGAFCQSEDLATASKALPDAPSVLFAAQPHLFEGISIDRSRSEEAGSPCTLTAIGLPSASARFQAAFDWTQERPSDQYAGQPTPSALFFKRLNTPNLPYRPSDHESLMGRATDAASWIVLARDPQGRRKFNSTYFLRLATSIAADSASRRYRAHSKTAPLSDAGSTVGNDAGMNLLHEFGPGLQHAVTSHIPRFISRVGEHLLR